MSEPTFHTVDSESLKNITIDQILAPKNPLEKADYNTPVPTEDKTIPTQNKNNNYIRIVYGLNATPVLKLNNGHRGKIGGC
ncbi:hypothetical protein NIES2101_22990 [Calothrix sp. HK-06]|nr:hypothetical protein NIES2101_22990 [Calothrix sp. HK-06]